MAAIRERKDQNGNVSYQAQVRILGYRKMTCWSLHRSKRQHFDREIWTFFAFLEGKKDVQNHAPKLLLWKRKHYFRWVKKKRNFPSFSGLQTCEFSTSQGHGKKKIKRGD